jgi:DNA polymerase-4
MEATSTQDARMQAELGAHLLHGRCPVGTSEGSYRQLLALIEGTTPVVQALPPAAVVANVAGAVRYFAATPYELAQRIRLQAAALLGIDVRIGVAATWSLAAMASARTGHGGIRLIADTPQAVAGFLNPLPVDALYGIGPQQAGSLSRFGLHTIGALADTPLATVQRILGGRAGRTLHDRARGIDPRPVIPAGLPASITEQRLLDHDVLDPDRLRTELLDAAVAVGDRLRRRHQVARSLTVGVAFADGSRIERSRTLREATAHTADLRTVATSMFNALGLQRARVRGLTLRAEQLADAAGAPQQITLDHARENQLRLEPVIDNLNARFGQHAVVPASLVFRHTA